jgi:bis(5'-adenosyl)-triphosphatase
VLPHLSDLTPEEISDLFLTVTRIQRTLKRIYKADAFNIAVQDGKAAGQSVPHVHCHVIPRTEKDPAGDDKIHEWLEGEEGNIGKQQQQAIVESEHERKVGEWAKDDERKPRTQAEMQEEAQWLRAEMAKDDNEEVKL